MREVTLEYTETRCGSCGRAARRYYREGDSLFKDAEACACGGRTTVESIYGETHQL